MHRVTGKRLNNCVIVSEFMYLTLFIISKTLKIIGFTLPHVSFMSLWYICIYLSENTRITGKEVFPRHSAFVHFPTYWWTVNIHIVRNGGALALLLFFFFLFFFYFVDFESLMNAVKVGWKFQTHEAVVRIN